MKYFIIILLVMAGLGYYALTITRRPGPALPSPQTADADTLPQTRDSLLNSHITTIRSTNAPLPLDSIVGFAETLLGIPYLYASSDPSKGFDCSGFITYVFNHFNIEVPRSSVDFTDKGVPVSLQTAQRGDLILFTGSDSASMVVGHMGIVTGNTDTLRFIHSSSGKAGGVTISPLNEHYTSRLVKIISVKNGL